jgi:nucleoside-diphosphate-sugar epimerase
LELVGKTLCITGVGGFIGLRMAERAQARGIHVRGIDLDPIAVARARRLGIDVLEGDLCDPQVARAGVQGCDAVFHTAAIVSEDASWELSRRVNVTGTVTMARAARNEGARRFIHLSSVMVYGFDYPEGITEEGPFDGANNPYCQTKLESDQAALAMHDPGRLDVTVIRPGDVYGPGCVSWVVRPIGLMKRNLFALVDGGKPLINHVHVDNLIDAVFAAIERDAVGTSFTITDGRRTSAREFFGYYAGFLGKRTIPSLPSALALPAFSALERTFARLSRPSPLHAAAVHFVRRKHMYSIAKAQRELDYVPQVSLEDGMSRLGEWLRGEGML